MSKDLYKHRDPDMWAKHLWQTGEVEPKDGQWQYIVQLVKCLECSSGSHFVFAHFKNEEWLSWEGDEPLWCNGWIVSQWMNLELFEQHGLEFDFKS